MTTIALDLKPYRSQFLELYQTSLSKTLNVTFNQFMLNLAQCYVIEDATPSESDVYIDSLIYGATYTCAEDLDAYCHVPDNVSEAYQQALYQGVNTLDGLLSFILNTYYGGRFLGGIHHFTIDIYFILYLHYGSEGI